MMERSGIRGRSASVKVIAWVVGAVLVVAIAAAAIFFFVQYKNLKDNPNAAAQETAQRLVGKVGQLYALPGDETPTVALVQDKDKLRDQSFFAKAENGDYIIIYTNAKLALLYREKDNKLINVGPVSISSQEDSTTGDSTQELKP